MSKRLLVASLLSIFAGCTDVDDGSESIAATQAAAAAPGCDPGGALRTRCNLSYYSNICPSGVCPSVTIDEVVVNSTAYPEFGHTFGTGAVPYVGFATSGPKYLGNGASSETDGWFHLILRDPNGQLDVSTEAEIILPSVAGEYVLAGDLRTKVAPFEYQGGSYNHLEALCTVDRL